MQRLLSLLLVALACWSCKPKTLAEAEAKKDVAWLRDNPSAESVAALGRIADTDEGALKALEGRAGHDVNAYIAAWTAVTRNAPWGTSFLRSALGDPTRAELAASAMPRRDPRLGPFIPDLEGAVVRLSAGRRGGVVAGVLASAGPQAHATVERRLMDPKTRGAMCDGIGLPEASGDAKSTLLAVPPEGRDHPSCIAAVIEMASSEDSVLGWLASSAEPGLLTAVAKGTLPCARVATLWQKGLVERGYEAHAAMAVPLQLSIRRCSPTLDPVLAELLTKTPRARACIVQALDPFSNDLTQLKQTCKALAAGWANAENARVRERARDAVNNGCKFAN
jgi:hypothetical protein